MADKPKLPKATKATMVKRLTETEHMLAKGWRHTMIVATLRANYPIGVKACEKLITRVYKKWRSESKAKKVELRSRQVNRLFAILEGQAITVTERVRVETLLARILGTEAPVQHAGVDDEPIKFVLCDYRAQTETKPE